MTWLLDLDGVVWLADQPVAGSADAIARLRAAGRGVVFLTNNSSATTEEYLAKLEGLGIPTGPDDLITSAQAAATLVHRGETVLVCAGPGVAEAVAARGAEPVRDGPADAVIVGWHRDFDFGRLTAAYDAVRGGARLLATNDDATYPTPSGAVPGGGAILAAVAYATGATAEIAGKPFAPIAELVRQRVADPEMVVGDRPSTDGALARRIGVPFALVLSGVTAVVDPDQGPRPEWVADNLADLVAKQDL